jgi:hypothetical protein
MINEHQGQWGLQTINNAFTISVYIKIEYTFPVLLILVVYLGHTVITQSEIIPLVWALHVPEICLNNSVAELYLIYKNGLLLWFSFNECIANQCHGHHKQEVAGVHKMQVDEGTLTLKAILQTTHQCWLDNILIFNMNKRKQHALPPHVYHGSLHTKFRNFLSCKHKVWVRNEFHMYRL